MKKPKALLRGKITSVIGASINQLKFDFVRIEVKSRVDFFSYLIKVPKSAKVKVGDKVEVKIW